MFANLKNKLIEEVKASPSKFQQLAQAASSSLSNTPNATTGTNENFFSITEEDTPQNSPYKPLKLPTGRSTTPQALNNGTGAIPRTRKLSNSSMASDVSFRLPLYDSPAVYHLQSDWEASGSEMGEIDESASMAKLDVITKEQLYDAYKKSLDRYNKYRCRYTDLAKKYKDLERDSTKARSVLVETQEKAIRRISELREQCTLEQQAKAHLEESLRMEMDDMQCKMQAYQTKLKLLGESPEHIAAALNQASAALIDLAGTNSNNTNSAEDAVTNGESETKLIAFDTEIAHENEASQILKLEKQLRERDEQLKALTIQLESAAGTIESLKKQEEENALLLAQTKQAIHSELENKEGEVKQLKDSVKKLQGELNAANKRETQLAAQVGETKELNEKLKLITGAKQEIEAKLIAAEHLLNASKADRATKEEALAATEVKLAAQLKEGEQKLQDLRQQNSQLNEMVQRYQQNEVSLAEVDNELNRTKNENDNLKTTIAANERQREQLQHELSERQQQIEAAEERAAASIARLVTLNERLEEERNAGVEAQTQRVQQLEAEMLSERNATSNESEAFAALKDEMHRASADAAAQLQALRDQLTGKEKELKATSAKLGKQKKQYDVQQNKIAEQNVTVEKLRAELNGHAEQLEVMQTEANLRDQQAELEKTELRTQVKQILEEIAQMEQQMHLVQQSHAELETEKRNLESSIGKMQQQQAATSDAATQQWRDELALAEEQRRLVEVKLQTVESENSQLAEKNCLLEENAHRLEKLAGERERQQQATNAAEEAEMRSQLETAEGAIQKLNEKLSQVLDENSRMQNAQELMDHDHRTLQDKCDALEKEKLLAQDAEQCAKAELDQLKECQATLQTNLQAAQQQLTAVNEELQETESLRQRLASEAQALSAQLDELRTTQSDDEKLRDLLQEKQRHSADLAATLAAQRLSYESESAARQQDIERLSLELDANERAKEELQLLREQKTSLGDEIAELTAALEQKAQNVAELQAQLAVTASEGSAQHEELQRCRAELEAKTTELGQLQASHAEMESAQRTELNELAARADDLRVEALETTAQHAERTAALELRLQQANADVERLHESNDALQVAMDQLRGKQELQVQELQQTLKQLQADHGKLQAQYTTSAADANKLASFEQLQIESEYLQNQVRQLEQQVEAQSVTAAQRQHDAEELREKFKSMQCELYVLKENAEAHDVQLRAKERELHDNREALQALQLELAGERTELQRQHEHANYITEQNDATQKELLGAQQRLADSEQKLLDIQAAIELEVLAKQEACAELDTLKAERAALESAQKQEAIVMATEQSVMGAARGASASAGDGSKHLRDINEALQRELEELKHRSTGEIAGLQQEIEDLQTNSRHMMERMMQLEATRADLQAQKLFAASATTATAPAIDESLSTGDGTAWHSEREELVTKLKTIMSEVQDVSNRNLFLEQKCENYLILEQSNERLKLQNSKVLRQLDETLVSMQHNEGITANTEFEYLKNIMFQYLTGTANGNNETLVKVISAVLKFSPQQTQVALEKEHQRRSLLNKIL